MHKIEDRQKAPPGLTYIRRNGEELTEEVIIDILQQLDADHQSIDKMDDGDDQSDDEVEDTDVDGEDSLDGNINGDKRHIDDTERRHTKT